MKEAGKHGDCVEGRSLGRKCDVISRLCSCSLELFVCITFGQKRKLLVCRQGFVLVAARLPSTVKINDLAIIPRSATFQLEF
jgi:hypothetical protein